MQRIVTDQMIFNEILHFYNLKDQNGKPYQIVPGTGFLAGKYKTSIETIRKRLNSLEERGLIQRYIVEDRKTKYELLSFRELDED